MDGYGTVAHSPSNWPPGDDSAPHEPPVGGLFFIYVSSLPPVGPKSMRRVVIANSHPLFGVVVQMALDAHARQADVKVGYLGESNLCPNCWDFGMLQVMAG
ncbi:unnamed protein product [Ostreobium quekettii]|uniref:Uncharacterized protein n=1 Tax=Ostreobium quekettii TaxID=121088 RepID=A0A8S1IZM4_9CHLO|nr:unnamed protein product [Ostreobium quekettii]